jgi:MbtH protein
MQTSATQVPTDDDADPFDTYRVVVNAEGDHSIWPAVRDLPNGWNATGPEGSKADCLAWIDANWSGPTA